MNRALDHIATFIATGFFSGRAPIAPGTVGSVVALIIGYFVLKQFGPFGLELLVAFGLFIGAWSITRYEAQTGSHDAPEVVVDEFVGMWIAMMALPLYQHHSFREVNLAFLAFLLFRVFDIFKPWPVNRAERLPGAIGVLADDIVAGIIAALIMAALYYFTPLNLFDSLS